jgi:hypothetical protein
VLESPLHLLLKFWLLAVVQVAVDHQAVVVELVGIVLILHFQFQLALL